MLYNLYTWVLNIKKFRKWAKLYFITELITFDTNNKYYYSLSRTPTLAPCSKDDVLQFWLCPSRWYTLNFLKGYAFVNIIANFYEETLANVTSDNTAYIF